MSDQSGRGLGAEKFNIGQFNLRDEFDVAPWLENGHENVAKRANRSHVEQEATFLQGIEHKNIVKILNLLPLGDQVAIVMPRAAKGDMLHHLVANNSKQGSPVTDTSN